MKTITAATLRVDLNGVTLYDGVALTGEGLISTSQGRRGRPRKGDLDRGTRLTAVGAAEGEENRFFFRTDEGYVKLHPAQWTWSV